MTITAFSDMSSSEITDSLIEEHYYPIMPISQALTVSGSAVGATVTELLTTSDASFSKVDGYDITTYEKEEGDIDGPFTVAVSVSCDGGGGLYRFGSPVSYRRSRCLRFARTTSVWSPKYPPRSILSLWRRHSFILRNVLHRSHRRIRRHR